MNKSNIETTFFKVAMTWADRSTCSSRAKVGCVLVNSDRSIVASGYNGSPRGLPHCDDVGCIIEGGHCVRALHAEENAIIQCARTGVSTVGTHLFSTHRPCVRCARLVIQAGIVSVTYMLDYDADDSRGVVMENFAAANVRVASYGILSMEKP